ncbi:hypothetical protein [Geothrix campi]|uniref:hypothetical protein n=1 Tax=Geothrix campi TaxID=2966450 RepID=UPI00214794B6|nr:hypothetical protein [Geothrix sp. SG10]
MAAGISCANKVQESKSGVITSPLIIGIRNLTVVEIIPNQEPVSIDWKGYGTLASNNLSGGYEKVIASDSRRTFVITDESSANNSLTVNGQMYNFDANNQHLEVHFASGVRVMPGANYQSAKHVYDITFPVPN